MGEDEGEHAIGVAEVHGGDAAGGQELIEAEPGAFVVEAEFLEVHGAGELVEEGEEKFGGKEEEDGALGGLAGGWRRGEHEG